MKFIINGEPIAKKRHRVSNNGGMYDSQERVKFNVQSNLKFLVTQYSDSKDKSILGQLKCLVEAEAFKIDIEFHCSPTKADPWGLKINTNPKDVDNLCKFYLDCANGILY